MGIKNFFKKLAERDLRASMLWSTFFYSLCGIIAILANNIMIMQIFFYYIAILLMTFTLYILIAKYL